MARQSVTKWSVYQLIVSLSVQERALELQRQLLAMMPDFEPYTAFCRLSKNKSFITKEDIWKFMLDNSKTCSHRHCKSFIILYDGDADGVISYKEFLDLILPKENVQLRASLSQKDCSSVRSSDTFAPSTEYLLCNLISADMQLINGVDSELKNLGTEFWVVTDLIMDNVTARRRGGSVNGPQPTINFNNLSEFIRKAGLDMSEQEVINIIKRLDRDNDGVVSVQDLETVVRAILEPDYQPQPVMPAELTPNLSRKSMDRKQEEIELSNEKARQAYQRSKNRNYRNLDKSREKLGLDPMKNFDFEGPLDGDATLEPLFNQRLSTKVEKTVKRDHAEQPRFVKEYFKEEVIERGEVSPRFRPKTPREQDSGSQEKTQFHLVENERQRRARREQEFSNKPERRIFEVEREDDRVNAQPKASPTPQKRELSRPRQYQNYSVNTEAQVTSKKPERDRTPSQRDLNAGVNRTMAAHDYVRERPRREPVVDKTVKEISPVPTPTLKAQPVPEDTTSVDLFFSALTKMLERQKGIDSAKRNLVNKPEFSSAKLFEEIAGSKGWIAQKDLLNYLQRIGVRTATSSSLITIYQMHDFSEGSLLTAEEFARLFTPSSQDHQEPPKYSSATGKSIGSHDRRAKQLDGETEALIADIFSRMLYLAKLVEEIRSKVQKGNINLESFHKSLTSNGKFIEAYREWSGQDDLDEAALKSLFQRFDIDEDKVLSLEDLMGYFGQGQLAD